MATLLLIIGIGCIVAAVYLFNESSQKNGAIHSTSQPARPDHNKAKGNAFEEFVIETIKGDLPRVRFLGKNSDYHKNGISAEENQTPDLKFQLGDQKFAVEAKYRSAFKNNQINWAKDYQIMNYNNYQTTENQRVFVMIGIGGTAGQPAELYCVPLYRITQGFATREFLQEFRYHSQSLAIP